MVHRSNLLALVGGGQAPKFPDSRVMIWDDSQSKFVYEINFKSKVLSIRMKKKRLFVVLSKEVNVFSFPHPLELELTIQTSFNPKGLFEVTPCLDKDVVFYPSQPADKCTGTVKVQDLSPSPVVSSFTIPAHQHSLAAMATNYEGTLIATASEKGTLVRVRDVIKNEPLAEFRRGADMAVINYLSFSLDSHFLCVCSDKGTVHIFAVFNRELNKKSTFAGSGISAWYTESQWGMAHVNLPKDTLFIAALDSSLLLHVVCWDGSHFKYRFNPHAKDSRFCYQESYNMYLCVGDDAT